ncbi:MAG TPA: hypothetical protein VNK96_01230 [Fimbriimonadales bacterium]|nr:hypothetical protein [Fimbriimonadales bacterium]
MNITSIVIFLALPPTTFSGSANSLSEPISFFAFSERFGYTGTVSVYNTFEDAKSGKNPRFKDLPFPQRDGSIFLVLNARSFWTDANIFLTNWYSNNGNNSNNQNAGFVQMYDINASNWKNHSGYWHSDMQTFTAFAKGANATYPSKEHPEDFARLWNAGAPPGSGESTKGTYLTYEYSLTATGLNAVDPDKDGFFENKTNATSYSGYFKGIFRNESKTSPASNGYYVVDLKFNSISWAAANNYAKDDRFGSNKVREK